MVRNINAHNAALIQRETQEATQRLHKLDKHTGHEIGRHLGGGQGSFSRKKGRSIAFVKEQYSESSRSSRKNSNETQKKISSKIVDEAPNSRKKTNIINNTSQNKCIKENIFPDQPWSPSIGLSVPSIYNCRDDTPSSGTLMLNSHFDPNYDPKLDVAVSSDESDDWAVSLRAVKDIAQWKKQRAQRLTETGFSSNMVSQITDEMAFPVYKKGLREWDRGKVVLENGEIETKALGWGKT
ncbi:unnamed protein product [Pneumocystis jirovecii]|nr:unnamed protein product [Pneumocystis jirovecii]